MKLIKRLIPSRQASVEDAIKNELFKATNKEPLECVET